MKRIAKKKLALEKQIVRALVASDLSGVAGGISIFTLCHTRASCPDTSYGPCTSIHSREPGC